MLAIIAFLLFFNLFTTNCLAESEFQIHQTMNYQVDSKGNASVIQETDLINNYSQIYAKEYKTILSGTNITNITATDKTGAIIDKIETKGEQTEVNLKFSQPVLGKDQKTHFTLTYTINKFATNKGNTWEVSLPIFKNLQNNDSLDINISLPSSFGNLSFSSIANPSIIYGNQTKITLSKNNINNKKILFVFGNNQLFDFNLKYILFNDSNESVYTEIALPPQTPSQTIILSQIEPKPENITVDPDGNWLAKYYLNPQETKEVSVMGQAKIHSPNKTTEPQPDDRWTKEDEYWPIRDSSITEISKKLNTPKQIYDYVVSTLSYSYSSINNARRKGALDALVSPEESLCTEFTDLFVTLARSRGIPAREIEGFAYTNNPKLKPVNQNADVLHAWPQYYDSSKKMWVSIDPTWEKTTNGIDYFTDLDLNHFVFAIHGLQSNYPAPAGAYKNSRQIKTVNVEFATNELKPKLSPPEIEVLKTSFNKPTQIKIKNPNLSPISQITVSLPKINWKSELENIPPHGFTIITLPNVDFFQSLHPSYKKMSFEVMHNNNSNPIFQSVTYYPHYLNLAITITGIIIILSFSGIMLTAKKKTTI